jgi:hypothetical protein
MLMRSILLAVAPLLGFVMPQVSFAQACAPGQSTVTFYTDNDGKGDATSLMDCANRWREPDFKKRHAASMEIDTFDDEISSLRIVSDTRVELSLFLDANYQGTCITFLANGGRLINLKDYRFHEDISSAVLNPTLHNMEVNCPIVDLAPPLPPAACPASYKPAAFGGQVATAAFFNSWSVPARVTQYHPNTGYTVGDDWGVCFENIPGISGRVYNLGTIAAYNPSGLAGQPLFMIQNDRL